LLAEAGVGFCKRLIVQIALLFQSCYCGRDDGVAASAGLDTGLHEAAQFRFSAHATAEGLDGVVVEAGLVEEGAGFRGFGFERQLPAPSFQI